MDPLLVDSLIEAGLLVLAGAVLGGGLYYFAMTRLHRSARRQAHIAAQLEAARARQVQHQIMTGPRFPRVAAHVSRICERAELIQTDLDLVAWPDPARRQRCLNNLDDLIRHCRELERVLLGPRRRGPS